ncbi:MAG: ornithine carbamoyltransferase [Pseudomonadota bacterium]
MSPKHFLDLWQLDKAELRGILDDAHAMKRARRGWPKGKVDPDAPLAGHTLAMIFEKTSTRTRFSFVMAMKQLGGDTIVSSASDMQLGLGETIEDTSQVLSRFVDAVMIRAKRHADVVEFAGVSTIPVINGLTDLSHPCQIIADLMTLEEHGIDIGTARLAWVGDGNNVCSSFLHASAKFGFQLSIGTPTNYRPRDEDVGLAKQLGATVEFHDSAVDAVAEADVVIADTFVSMGDSDRDQRLEDLHPFKVTSSLMAEARPAAVFLHCLPAHRGEEVDAEVIDGPRSLVFDEAENRLHAQKAILKWCLTP